MELNIPHPVDSFFLFLYNGYLKGLKVEKRKAASLVAGLPKVWRLVAAFSLICFLLIMNLLYLMKTEMSSKTLKKIKKYLKTFSIRELRIEILFNRFDKAFCPIFYFPREPYLPPARNRCLARANRFVELFFGNLSSLISAIQKKEKKYLKFDKYDLNSANTNLAPKPNHGWRKPKLRRIT